jgi:hypothetical protein
MMTTRRGLGGRTPIAGDFLADPLLKLLVAVLYLPVFAAAERCLNL